MRYTAASILAFASAVLAQTANFDVISKPTADSVVPAGKTYTITWAPTTEYNNDTITLTLLGGATPKTLQPLSIIQAGVNNSAGELAWAVSSSLGADANYGIEITLDSNPKILEYSFPFTISGGDASSSSGSASASGSATGSSSAASSAPASTTLTKTTSKSSSSAVTTTSTSSSSSSAAPTTLTTQTSAAGNGTVTTVKPSGSKTVVTATHTATQSGAGASGTASTVSTSDAKSLGAGSFITLIGGLTVALFAL